MNKNLLGMYGPKTSCIRFSEITSKEEDNYDTIEQNEDDFGSGFRQDGMLKTQH